MPFNKLSHLEKKRDALVRNVVHCSTGCGNCAKYIVFNDTIFYLSCSCRALVCSRCYSLYSNSFKQYTCIYCISVGYLDLFRPRFDYPIPPEYLCWQQFLSKFQQFNPRISNWVIFSRMIRKYEHMLFDDKKRDIFFEFFLRLQSPILRARVAAHRLVLSHLAITPQLC